MAYFYKAVTTNRAVFSGANRPLSLERNCCHGLPKNNACKITTQISALHKILLLFGPSDDRNMNGQPREHSCSTSLTHGRGEKYKAKKKEKKEVTQEEKAEWKGGVKCTACRQTDHTGKTGRRAFPCTITHKCLRDNKKKKKRRK